MVDSFFKSNKSFLSTIAGYLLGIHDKIPTGYKEDIIMFTVASVGEVMVATQLSLQTGTEYIMKDIEVYFSGTTQADAYLKLNTAATDVAATRIASRYYQTGSFIHLDGNANGIIGAVLSAAPYLHLSAGVASVAQTVYVTIKYYYK